MSAQNDTHPLEPGGLHARIVENVPHVAPETDLQAMATMLSIFSVFYRILQDFETTVHRPSGLTWASFRVLFAIQHAGPLTPRELAVLFSVSQASISSVLNTLERDGLVNRGKSAQDGRKVVVSLTPLGERTATELFRRQHAREVAWSKALTARERDTFERLLAKLMRYEPAPPAEPASRLEGLPTP